MYGRASFKACLPSPQHGFSQTTIRFGWNSVFLKLYQAESESESESESGLVLEPSPLLKHVLNPGMEFPTPEKLKTGP